MSGCGLVKVKQFKKLPAYFELVYNEVADVFRMWAKEQNLDPIVLKVDDRSAISVSEFSAISIFYCNRPKREIPESKHFSTEELRMFAADLKLILFCRIYGEKHSAFNTTIEVRHSALAEPAVLLAEMLEQHLKSWLPKGVSFSEIEVEYKF